MIAANTKIIAGGENLDWYRLRMKSFGFNARVDMTVGNPVRQILLSSSPLIAVNIISLFTSSLTTSIYSTCVGSVAFSVTSALTTITSLYINILAGIISSAQIYLSRCIGAGEREKIPVCVINSVYLLLFIHLTAGAALIIFATPVLRLLNIPAQIFSQSLLYFRFYIGFYFFTALSSMLISFSVCFGSVSHVFLLHIANLLLGLFFALLYLAVFGSISSGSRSRRSSNGLVLSLVSITFAARRAGWRKARDYPPAGQLQTGPEVIQKRAVQRASDRREWVWSRSADFTRRGSDQQKPSVIHRERFL